MMELERAKQYIFQNCINIKRNIALQVFYKIVYRIVKFMKYHTIAEKFTSPTSIDMANIMVGESAGKLLSRVPLSNNTIIRRIQHGRGHQ
ncbi:hypothetical protein NPIL_471581 [Nephila pilipes]|uniref:Uncharacterized protein n=1 Tax=Nephila pilipes TaxID=299642 RepID=A0A8X6NX24_NEPPI|nr:hypothetical protein NPIL_471581 [Nephila pilipes]